MLNETKTPMKEKIAVTSSGGSLDALVSEKFGRCSYFIIYDPETKKFDAISNLGEQMSNGAGPKAAELIINNGAKILLTQNVGDKAEDALKRAGIKIVTGFTGNEKVKDALNKYLNEN